MNIMQTYEIKAYVKMKKTHTYYTHKYALEQKKLPLKFFQYIHI